MGQVSSNNFAANGTGAVQQQQAPQTVQERNQTRSAQVGPQFQQKGNQHSTKESNQQEPSSSSRGAQQQYQQQQQAASPAGQRRQQSGETLSSFESDYDLLIYLGETETEDLIETERSADYQDQTWRQSICGGASLAPTIDESLSELLSSFGGPAGGQTQASAASQWAAGGSLSSSPAFGQGAARSPRAAGGRGATPMRPHPADQWPLGPERGQEHALERAAGARDQDTLEQLLQFAAAPARASAQPPHGWESSSLPRRPAHSKRAPGPAADTLGPQAALKPASSSGGWLTSPAPPAGTQSDFSRTMPHPARRQTAREEQRDATPTLPSAAAGHDELDRLLAEMSQSLDLDSLARFDPLKGRPSLDARRPPTEPSGAPARGAQLVHSGSHAHQAKVEAGSVQEPQWALDASSANSLLDEYDGASRMLEQMISEQLAGEKAASSGAPDKQQQETAETVTSAPSGAQWARKASLTGRQASGGEQEGPEGRKVSTCSSSAVSVIANTSARRQLAAAGQQQEHAKPARPSHRSESSLAGGSGRESGRENGAPSGRVKLSETRRETAANKWGWSRSFEAPQSAAATRPAPQTGRRLRRARLSASSSDSSSSVPPPVPEVDYMQPAGRSGSGPLEREEGRVIQLEAAELPSGEEEPRLVERVKRRTLLGMRQVGHRLASAATRAAPQAARVPAGSGATLQASQPVRVSAERVATGAQLERSQRVAGEPGGPFAVQAAERQSRGRARSRGQAAQSTPPERQSFGQQLRERLSRSKSRLRKLLPLGSKSRSPPGRPADSPRPHDRPGQKSPQESDDDEPLAQLQPSDIARNSQPQTRSAHSAAGSAPVRASRPEGAREGAKREPVARGGRRGSSSGSSGELEGLEAAGGRKPARRKAAPQRRGLSVGVLAGWQARTERAPPPKRSPLKAAQASKRQRNKSAPIETAAREQPPDVKPQTSPQTHQRVEVGPRVRTASVWPEVAGVGRRGRLAPLRSQSLRSVGGVSPGGQRGPELRVGRAAGPSSGQAHERPASLERAAPKSVSFSDLKTSGAHRRRPFSPVEPNSFRPASALSSPATEQRPEVQSPASEQPPRLAALQQVRLELTAATPEPVGPMLVPLAPPQTVSGGQPGATSAKPSVSPMRERGRALIGDLRAKCNKLFLGQPRAAASAQEAPPARPPRRRLRGAAEECERKRRARSLVAQSGDESARPEVAPAAREGADCEPARRGATLATISTPKGAQPGKLAALAAQLRHSASEFFHQQTPRPPATRPKDQQGAANISTSTSGSGGLTLPPAAHRKEIEAPTFRPKSAEEPTSGREADLCEWRPVISCNVQQPAEEQTGKLASSLRSSFRAVVPQSVKGKLRRQHNCFM